MSDKPKQFRDVDSPEGEHRLRIETLLESMNMTIKLGNQTLAAMKSTLEHMHDELRRIEKALENLDVILDNEKSTNPVHDGIPTVPIKET